MSMFADKVILGASAFACGYAAAHKESLMILEPTILVGSEFTVTYRSTPWNLSETLSPLSRSLSAVAARRNLLLPSGAVSIPPISGILSQILLDAEVPILLSCCVEKISKQANGFCISFFGMDGWEQIECRQILDTTALGVRRMASHPQKMLRAMLSGENAAVQALCSQLRQTDLSLIKGRFETEYAIGFLASSDVGYVEARRILVRKWKDEGIAQWRIAAISPIFDYIYDSPVCVTEEDGFQWIPSASYPTLLAAFEGGVRCDM